MAFSKQNKYRIKSSTGIFHTWSSFITENPNPKITTFLFSLEYVSARCNISSFNVDTAVKFKRLCYEDIVHCSTLFSRSKFYHAHYSNLTHPLWKIFAFAKSSKPNLLNWGYDKAFQYGSILLPSKYSFLCQP